MKEMMFFDKLLRNALISMVFLQLPAAIFFTLEFIIMIMYSRGKVNVSTRECD